MLQTSKVAVASSRSANEVRKRHPKKALPPKRLDHPPCILFPGILLFVTLPLVFRPFPHETEGSIKNRRVIIGRDENTQTIFPHHGLQREGEEKTLRGLKV